MIEDVEKYINNMDAEDTDSVRESVLAQFGPDYCVISTHAMFRILTTAFYMSLRTKPQSAEMCREMGTIHGSEIKPGLVGAGFDVGDVIAMVRALREDAIENHD